MSEMAPEPGAPGGGGGNILTGRMLGIPGFVWLAGAAVVAYFLFFRGTKSSGSPTTTGGGGTIDTSGSTTTIDKGAIQVTVTQNPQPGPPKPPKTRHHKMVKVPQVAGKRASFGISDIESMGLEVIQTNPLRNPKDEYVVTGTVPAAGSMVAEGSKVRLNVRKVAPRQRKAA